MKTQIGNARLADLITQLGKAAFEIRVQAPLAEQIAQRALMSIAQSAQTLSRGAGLRR